MRWLVAALALLVLPACDAENVRWKVRSNPSGEPPRGGGVVVVVHGEKAEREEGGTGTVRVWVIPDAEVEVLESGETRIHGRALPVEQDR